MTKHLLLTGATGLVGGYLLREFLTREVPLAVLVRPSRGWSPRQRIENLLDRWEKAAGRALPRPVILTGDILAPGLGLSRDERAWVGRQVGGVLHNAASLEFVAKDRQSEPWRSNLDGTVNVLEFCREQALRRFFHVSTAYVAGLRTGRILERDLNCGQAFGNPYEESKLLAETAVRGASFLDGPTVLRPAIIVGDSRTSFTSTFHGFYAPLKAAASLLEMTAATKIDPAAVMPMFGLRGGEAKNFVPVDWVAALIARVVLEPRHHHETYHLVPCERTSLALMAEVIGRAVGRHLASRPAKPRGETPPIDLTAFAEQMTEMLEVYRPYWRDDPEFDYANVERIAADLPCPHLDEACLERLCRYAIEANFGFPRPPAVPLPLDLPGLLEGLVETDPGEAAGPAREIGLNVTGVGGGPWTLRCRGPRVVALSPGLGPGAGLHLGMRTLVRLRQEGTGAATGAIRSGRVLTLGTADEFAGPAALLERLVGAAPPAVMPR